MQEYIVNNCNSFVLKHIFECGQCFRWNEDIDGSYTGVFGKNVINIKQEGDNIVFSGVCGNDIEGVCIDYFDLDTDYEKSKEKLIAIDDYLKISVQYGNGIRILKQDLWETIISFIISANNNIPRIKGIIERLCQNYGDEIIFNNKKFYTFPTVEQLSSASVEDLRKLGLGFRDKRVYETTQLILNKVIDLDEMKREKDVNKIKENLLKLPGVGEKVADCIMLFSLGKLEVFPIDVWVRRVMNELYIKNDDEAKVSKKDILALAREQYGDLAGLAQQYLFYWRRSIGVGK